MKSVLLKYNYIIAGGSEFYEAAYYDLFNLSNVRYFNGFTDRLSCVDKFISRMFFSYKIPAFIKRPFRNHVYKHLFPVDFNDTDNLCFIFFENLFVVLNSSYIDFLKKKNPGVRLVLYMQDIVLSNRRFDIMRYKQKFDIVISYNKGDCVKYGLYFYQTPYSIISAGLLKKAESYESDVFFCGHSKNRYDKIISAFEQCTQKGLTCNFYIYGVPRANRLYPDTIHYDTKISYWDNLRYVSSSKCILEIMQGGADGYTLRLWESIVYDKHLLTDNAALKDSVFYNPNYMHFCFENDIDSWIDRPVSYSVDSKNRLSPIHLLEFIEDLFSRENSL